MRDDVASAMTKSAAAFRDVVWPAIGFDLGGGELVPVESVTSTGFAEDLDVLAGVDAWQVVDDHGMRPIASRVQAGWGPMDTFTIRWSLRSGNRTEIDKRIDALRHGYLLPTFTIQAYLDCPQDPYQDPRLGKRRERTIGGSGGCRCGTWTDHPILSIGCIGTVKLYEWADAWRLEHGDEDHLWRVRDGAYVKDVTGGNQMLVIPWKTLADTTVWPQFVVPEPVQLGLAL